MPVFRALPPFAETVASCVTARNVYATVATKMMIERYSSQLLIASYTGRLNK